MENQECRCNRLATILQYSCLLIIITDELELLLFLNSYHHTISATLLYGLREALAVVCKEGLDNIIARHQQSASELKDGLNELGLELYVRNPAYRLPTITSVKIPKEVDWRRIVEIAANEYAQTIVVD